MRVKIRRALFKLILFGSRARGDHQPNSDADVAIMMRNPVDEWWPLTQSVLEETYEILLDTGLDIQPHVIDRSALKRPARAINPELTREILKDGYTL